MKRIQGRRRREERSKDLMYSNYLLSVINGIEEYLPGRSNQHTRMSRNIQ